MGARPEPTSKREKPSRRSQDRLLPAGCLTPERYRRLPLDFGVTPRELRITPGQPDLAVMRTRFTRLPLVSP